MGATFVAYYVTNRIYVYIAILDGKLRENEAFNEMEQPVRTVRIVAQRGVLKEHPCFSVWISPQVIANVFTNQRPSLFLLATEQKHPIPLTCFKRIHASKIVQRTFFAQKNKIL